MVWILYGYSHSSAEETEAKRGDMVKVRARVRTALRAIRQLAGRTDGDIHEVFSDASVSPQWVPRCSKNLDKSIWKHRDALIAIQRALALTDDPLLRKPTMASTVSVDSINWVKTCPPTA